jgi:hypothetical protein
MTGKGVRTTDRRTRHGEFIDRELKRLRHKPYVKVGILAGNFNERKKARPGEKPSPAKLGEVAVYNEFGTSDGKIPERSFIRATHDRKKGEWIRRTDTLRRRVMAGQMTVNKGLGLVGEMIQKDIKDRILSNVPPPNRPATIAAKTRAGNRGDRTLIDTSQLLGSVHWSRHENGNH